MDAYKRTGTLAAASEELHITQPSLSRSMKKIEDILGVPLFDRQRNKITLNANGELAADYARQILELQTRMISQVRELDRKQRTIAFGACAPIPRDSVGRILSNVYQNMSILTETKGIKELLNGLYADDYQLIILPFKADDASLYQKACGSEQLLFALPEDHPYVNRKTLSFKDMDGQNMLLFFDIGFWFDLTTEKMPNSRFLVQTDIFSFNELVSASTLPSFATKEAVDMMGSDSVQGRILIPITDKEASVTYYCVCKKENQYRFRTLFSLI
ncbi:MAG: LysR family transcriptional regulator [Eubacteriales bacterium]|nr:LysR family transcriptional regulator [Eubacteriales bacterium]